MGATESVGDPWSQILNFMEKPRSWAGLCMMGQACSDVMLLEDSISASPKPCLGLWTLESGLFLTAFMSLLGSGGSQCWRGRDEGEASRGRGQRRKFPPCRAPI